MGTPEVGRDRKGVHRSYHNTETLGTWISCLWCVIYGILKLIGQLWLPDSQLETIRLNFT